MKFGDIPIDSTNKIVSISDIKLLKNIDIRVKETVLRYNEERMGYVFKTFTIIGKIGGFKMHKSSNIFLLLLLRRHNDLNLSSKYHIQKGIYPIEYLVTSYHRGVVNFNQVIIDNNNNNSYQYGTVDVIGKISGFKLGSYFSQDELYFLILLHNNINLNFNDKSIIDKGIFSLFHSNPFYNVCKVKSFYYLTNDFQGYDYYVWLSYKYYLECIKVIRWIHNTTNSSLPLIIYL